MLTALNSSGEKVSGWDAKKEDEYICPQCKQRVFLRKGIIKIPHFAHYPDSSPCTWWEPETEEHLMMKIQIMNLIKRDNKVTFADFEHKLFDYADNKNLYPDVCVELSNRKRIAIECQVSNKSLVDFNNRTEKYSRMGVYVLWLFSHDTFLGNDYEEEEEIRVPAMLLQSHFLNYGRIYTIQKNQTYINAVHFYRICRINEWTGGQYYPKTLRTISVKRLRNAHLCCVIHKQRGTKIARFCDRKWWK